MTEDTAPQTVPPASAAEAAASQGRLANWHLRNRLTSIKSMLTGFEHEIDDDLKEIAGFIKAKI